MNFLLYQLYKIIFSKLKHHYYNLFMYIPICTTLHLMMPKILSKSHSPHVLKTTPAQHKKRRPHESIDVIPAKDPLKVKLENFLHNSRVPNLG